MYRRLLTLFYVFFFTTLRAQQDTTLITLYRLPDDSNKLKKILSLGEALEDKDTIQSYKLYQEALRLSTDLKLYYYQSRTLNNLGILSRKKMDFQSALLYYTKSIAAAERIPDELRVASAQTNIANVLIKLNQLEEAATYFQRSIVTYEKVKASKQHIQALCGLGILYQQQGLTRNSIDVLKKAITKAHEIGSDEQLLKCYNTISVSYFNCSGLKEYLNACFQSLYYCRRVGTSSDFCIVYNNIASYYVNQKKYQLAQLYSDSSVLIANQLQLPELTIQTKMQRANIACEMKQFQFAHQLLDEIKPLIKSTKSWKVQSDYQKSCYRLTRAEGNKDSAIIHLSKRIEYVDSLTNSKAIAYNLELDRKYETRKKELEIKQLQKDRQFNSILLKQKNYFLLGSLLGLLLLGIITFLLYLNTKRKQRISKQTILSLQQEKKLKTAGEILQAQEDERKRFAKDLHDGLGSLLSGVKLSLSSIQGAQIIPEQSVRILNSSLQQLDNAIHEIRVVAHNMMPESLERFGLVEALQNICSNLQTSSAISIHFEALHIKKRLPKELEIVSYRILQELLNNAIKHSSCHQIIVQLSEYDTHIHLLVEDDGIGFNNNGNFGGMGLKNIQARAEYMNGTVNIRTQPNQGCSILIEFPLPDNPTQL
ncbi:MAG: sensor histidine kinase [Chitinophagaceae bacterium]|nr:sensor histidine kinase [Chitinophagaceae bacterium]